MMYFFGICFILLGIMLGNLHLQCKSFKLQVKLNNYASMLRVFSKPKCLEKA